MALKNTRAGNYPEWYQNVVSEADMAENSSSPGCMVIKPWGYGIWERIRDVFDEKSNRQTTKTVISNVYPAFLFQKEAEHVDGFAKEMAVVTHSRLSMKDGKLVPDSELDEPLIVRPTSEAIIADSFSKWVKSYRDLPVLVNQWANVVRWEMRPRLFLRTREFYGRKAIPPMQPPKKQRKKQPACWKLTVNSAKTRWPCRSSADANPSTKNFRVLSTPIALKP